MAGVKRAGKVVKTSKGVQGGRRAGIARGLPLTEAIDLSLKLRRGALEELAKR